jgi:hypothetical protein
MAFALTAAYAYPQLISSPTGTRRGNQVIELQITATTADVDLDIGDLDGTFWGDVDASSMGASVLAAVTLLYPQFDTVGTISVASPQLIDRVQIGTVSGAGEYSLAIDTDTLLPNIEFNAADGEEVIYITITAQLNNSNLGATWSYSA